MALIHIISSWCKEKKKQTAANCARVPPVTKWACVLTLQYHFYFESVKTQDSLYLSLLSLLNPSLFSCNCLCRTSFKHPWDVGVILQCKSIKNTTCLQGTITRCQPLLLWFLYNHSLREWAAEPSHHLPSPPPEQLIYDIPPSIWSQWPHIHEQLTLPVSIPLCCGHMVISLFGSFNQNILKHICICLYVVFTSRLARIKMQY